MLDLLFLTFLAFTLWLLVVSILCVSGPPSMQEKGRVTSILIYFNQESRNLTINATECSYFLLLKTVSCLHLEVKLELLSV